VHTALKDSTRSSTGGGSVWGRGNRLRRALVVSELALCTMLLISAGLLIRSFRRVQEVAPGFDPQGVLTLELTMSGPRYKDGQAVIDAYRQFYQGLEQLPGVTAAGAVTSLPLSEMYAWGPITVEGRVPPPGENFINADERMVSGDYFQAMGIPLRAGRFFSDQDTKANPRVAIVDDFMAQQLWPHQDPVGRRIHLGGVTETEAAWITVVGVVGRVKQYTLDSDSRIAFYLPHTQYPARAMNVVLRSQRDPAKLAAAVGRTIHQVDSDLPLYNVRTMRLRLEGSLARRRFSMLLLTLFAAFALALAAVGIYGVMAFLVSQGTREIGIRLALGATPGGILRLIVSKGMALTVCGLAIGLIGALGLTRLMTGLLFGVSADDPATFFVIAMFLGLTALLASYVPAHRAAQVDPMVSLRYE